MVNLKVFNNYFFKNEKNSWIRLTYWLVGRPRHVTSGSAIEMTPLDQSRGCGRAKIRPFCPKVRFLGYLSVMREAKPPPICSGRYIIIIRTWVVDWIQKWTSLKNLTRGWDPKKWAKIDQKQVFFVLRTIYGDLWPPHGLPFNCYYVGESRRWFLRKMDQLGVYYGGPGPPK